MILNEDRIKRIADKVRALPDAVLADIGFERVMGMEVVADRAPPDQSDPGPDAPLMQAIVEYLRRYTSGSMWAIRRDLAVEQTRLRKALDALVSNCLIECRGKTYFIRK